MKATSPHGGVNFPAPPVSLWYTTVAVARTEVGVGMPLPVDA